MSSPGWKLPAWPDFSIVKKDSYVRPGNTLWAVRSGFSSWRPGDYYCGDPESERELVARRTTVDAMEGFERTWAMFRVPRERALSYEVCVTSRRLDPIEMLSYLGDKVRTKKVKKNPAPKGVMLAKAWEGSDPTGWLMSEKLDGVRAYWTGDTLYTRNGNRIFAPAWWLRALPKGIALDGELWVGRKQFQKTVSYIRKDKPIDAEWKKVAYLIFDAPEVSGGCEVRFAATKTIVREMCKVYGAGCPLIALEHEVCDDEEDLQSYLERVEKLGGEGVMLRRPGSKYSMTRTSDLLKVKSFVDEEAKIVGYLPGKGKHAGRLGAYQCKLLSSGVRFDVGTGLTDRQREKPLLIGTVITVKYQELSDDGVPRFPSFVGVRGD